MLKQVTSVIAVALLAGLLVFAQEGPKPEHYAATWAVTGGGAGGTMVSIDVRINKFNTDALRAFRKKSKRDRSSQVFRSYWPSCAENSSAKPPPAFFNPSPLAAVHAGSE